MVSLKGMLYYWLEQPFDVFDVKELRGIWNFLPRWTKVEQQGLKRKTIYLSLLQGGIACGTIDEASRSSKAIDKCVIINARDKNYDMS